MVSAIIIGLCVVECGNQSFASVDKTAIVDRAILSLVDKYKAHPMNNPEKRLSMANDIVDAGEKYNVPVLLITTIIFKESSFKTAAKGRIGEIGLMQVHGVARRGCTMAHQSGQIDCGARWLAKCYTLCKTPTGALTAYATGRCKATTKRVERVVRSRLRLWEKLRGIQ